MLHFQAGFVFFPVLLCGSDRAMFLGTEPRASHILHTHVFYHAPASGCEFCHHYMYLFWNTPPAFPWFIHGVKTVNSHRFHFFFFHSASFLSFSPPVHVAVTWFSWILRWAGCNRNEQFFFPCWSLRFLLWFFFLAIPSSALMLGLFSFLFSWLYQSCFSILWTMCGANLFSKRHAFQRQCGFSEDKLYNPQHKLHFWK